MSNLMAKDLDCFIEQTEPFWAELRNGRILITGATGFFGCWFLESFAWVNKRLGLNAQAVAVARHPELLESKAPHLLRDNSIQLQRQDICQEQFPVGPFTHAIHAATPASAALNEDSPLSMFDITVHGTSRTLDFAVRSGVSKFLFTSSGAVYGPQPAGVSHIDEECRGGPDPLNRKSAYAEGKRAAEMLCSLYASPAFEPKIARCFAFVGPYMKLDAHFAIGNFIHDRISDSAVRVKGDGTTVRSYLYASDLMVWLWTILFRGTPCRAYNVGSDEAVSIRELANEVASLQPEVKVEIGSTGAAQGPIDRYVPSTTRARRELGLRETVSRQEAIRRTCEWAIAMKQHAYPSPAEMREACCR